MRIVPRKRIVTSAVTQRALPWPSANQTRAHIARQRRQPAYFFQSTTHSANAPYAHSLAKQYSVLAYSACMRRT